MYIDMDMDEKFHIQSKPALVVLALVVGKLTSRLTAPV